MGNLVLMVDDDEKLQKLLREYLENNGFRVLGLGDGSHVRETIERISGPGDSGYYAAGKGWFGNIEGDQAGFRPAGHDAHGQGGRYGSYCGFGIGGR